MRKSGLPPFSWKYVRCRGRLNQHSRSYRVDATIDCSNRQKFSQRLTILMKERGMDRYFNFTIHRSLDLCAALLRSPMRVLITGDAGFIGRHVVEHFHDRAEVGVLTGIEQGPHL